MRVQVRREVCRYFLLLFECKVRRAFGDTDNISAAELAALVAQASPGQQMVAVQRAVIVDE